MTRRIVRLLSALALVGVFLVPAPSATAQATRTWVSGVGDDANPCSRTAPCRTFAGAMTKTAAGGEINALDPGGFGALTINKSLTVNACTVGLGGVLTNVSNGITVNAASTDRVTLRCLDINGLNSNFHGIRVLSARTVKIVDSEIYGFNRNGISVENSANGAKVTIIRNLIRDNGGNGVMVAPPNGIGSIVTLRNNDIVDNTCGVTAAQFGPDPAFNYASNCGVLGSGNSGVAVVTNLDNLIVGHSSAGVFSRGAQGINRVGLNQVVNNGFGLQSVDGGQILSWSNNLVTGNNNNGAATGTIGPLAP